MSSSKTPRPIAMTGSYKGVDPNKTGVKGPASTPYKNPNPNPGKTGVYTPKELVKQKNMKENAERKARFQAVQEKNAADKKAKQDKVAQNIQKRAEDKAAQKKAFADKKAVDKANYAASETVRKNKAAAKRKEMKDRTAALKEKAIEQRKASYEKSKAAINKTGKK